MKDKFKVEINMDQEMCFSCKKTSSDYYQLKLQLRYIYFDEYDKIKEETAKIIEKNFNSMNKLLELDNGFDIFFSNRHEMNKISSLFQRRYLIEEKRSKKVVGKNFLESKDVCRFILLINIINISKGDTISIKGEEFTIKALNNNDLVLLNVINGSKKVVPYKSVKDYLKLISKRKANIDLE